VQIGSRATPGSATLPTSAGAPGIRSITNGATFQVKDILHPMASNSFVSIFASNIGSIDTPQSIFPATSYQGLSVEFNRRASPLYYVFPSLGQINLVTPSDLGASGTATVALVGASGASQTLTLTLGATDIGIFRLTDPSDARRENGAVLFANTSWDVIPTSMATALGLRSCAGQPLNASCGQPARTGDAIEIYFTGGGEATPGGNSSGTPLATGQVAPLDGSVLYQTVLTPTVQIGGISAPGVVLRHCARERRFVSDQRRGAAWRPAGRRRALGYSDGRNEGYSNHCDSVIREQTAKHGHSREDLGIHFGKGKH
jgi:uncharacterized protein (TIGR03437 family)